MVSLGQSLHYFSAICLAFFCGSSNGGHVKSCELEAFVRIYNYVNVDA